MFTKHFFTLTLTCSSFFAAYSQTGMEADYPQQTIKLYDKNGKRFTNPDIDIDGTPFFNEKWKYGTVTLTNDKSYKVPLRLNLKNQEVHFLGHDKSEMAVLPGTVKEVIFIDTVNNQQIRYDFKCGYSPIDYQDEKNFYLVLSEGKLNLIESMRKKVRQQKDDLSGEVKKELITYEDYYFSTNSNLIPVKLNKAYLLKAMHDQESKIDDFVKANKLSYKSGDDLRKIVTYYNSL